MTRRDRTVTHEIECGPVTIEVRARVSPPVSPSGFDPGDGGEVELLAAYRYEGNHPPLRQVPVSLDALLSVIGPGAWAELEQTCAEMAAEQDDGPDADYERDQEMDR